MKPSQPCKCCLTSTSSVLSLADRRVHEDAVSWIRGTRTWPEACRPGRAPLRPSESTPGVPRSLVPGPDTPRHLPSVSGCHGHPTASLHGCTPPPRCLPGCSGGSGRALLGRSASLLGSASHRINSTIQLRIWKIRLSGGVMGLGSTAVPSGQQRGDVRAGASVMDLRALSGCFLTFFPFFLPVGTAFPSLESGTVSNALDAISWAWTFWLSFLVKCLL